MRHTRRRAFQLTHRIGGAAFGVGVEQLAAGLHEHNDEAGNRLAQYDGRDDREHRHDIGRKVTAEQAAQRFPGDGCSREHQRQQPDAVRERGVEDPNHGSHHEGGEDRQRQPRGR